MRRAQLLIVLFVTAVVAVAGVAFVLAGPTGAKEYTVRSVVIDATVRPNGDLRVRETRTLDFVGQFSYVYWDLNTKGSNGIEVKAAEGPEPGGTATVPYQAVDPYTDSTPGTYWVEPGTDASRVQLNFSVADTTADFVIDYVAKGAATRWTDTAELYWQFVGDEALVPSEDVRIMVHLPDGVSREQVRAWAHGPLWGNVTIQDDASVLLTVSPLPVETFVEGRILFPAAALSNAPVVNQAHQQAVLEEEQQLADEANRARQWARVRVILWGIVGFGLPLVALILVGFFYIRYGREPKTRFQAEYLRDIPEPDLPPALMGYIWRMGKLAQDDATATLLDLINRKVIDLERVTVHKERLFGKDEKLTYRMTLHEEKLVTLSSQERKLVTFLFHDIAGGSTIILSELKELAKDNRATFAREYKEWQTKVTNEAEARGYLVAKASTMAWVGSAIAFVAAGGAVAAAVFSGWFWFLVAMPVALALIVLARAIKRRSQEAAELHAQYAALRHYLKDFGRMDEKPPDAVVLWEHFLVYAVVFGIADEVVKAMKIKVPDVINDPGFAPMYWVWFATPGDGGGLSAFGELHQSFTEAISVATSSSSSGSGMGGGFSGGGGGGGGGGGFGAG